MLLSFERLVVGAFVFLIPRAMLLLHIGLVQAVLPESKNMRKRTLGVPQVKDLMVFLLPLTDFSLLPTKL